MNRMAFGLLVLVAAGCRKDWERQDLDADGVTAVDGDCNNGDPAVNPSATEVCDGRDNNCDGTTDEGVGTAWFTDADADGFGDDATSVTSCFPPPAGGVTLGGDCDDADGAVHPGANESCDQTDDLDCDGKAPGEDGDEDGFAACEDCDDADEDVNPAASETCDDADNDCDGVIDDAPSDTEDFFADLDGDGHGSDRIVMAACEAPEGFVSSSDDCDDLSGVAYPGASELCDGADNDCNGTIDDGATGTSTYYADTDKDGYGNPSSAVDACAQPAGYTDNDDDCNDTDAKYNPEGVESCSDPADYNCDGSVGQADSDNDGTPACTDCDDANAAVEPGASEICDGLDNDCNGQTDEIAPTWYADVDGDTHGGMQMTVVACTAPAGFVSSSDDCNDLQSGVYPGAVEACNGWDDDCAGGVPGLESDADGDHWRGCEGDCNDSSKTVSPAATERCNGVDDDCDGTNDNNAADAPIWYADADTDGWGTAATTKLQCTAPAGYVATVGDCNDGNKNISPVAEELCSTSGVDDDCDGTINESNAKDATAWYLDADNDAHGKANNFQFACTAPSGRVALGDDCDDTKNTVYTGATEVWYDGIDQNCDGKSDFDQDGDKYDSSKFAGGTDCDDTSASVTACMATCASILAANPSAASGPYTIDPQGDGTGFDTWCDMTRDGGGWTLVLQNNTGVSTASRGDLSWAEATGSRSIVRGGNMTSWAGQGGFDIWVGLSNWNAIGTRARQEAGPSVNNPTRQAMYNISIGAPSTNYQLNLSNITVTIGGVTPDMYNYHSGRPLTTYDRDNDINSGNCATYYQHPFWYGTCWSGSMWGSDIGGYQPSPYWTSSVGDYYTWGALWIR